MFTKYINLEKPSGASWGPPDPLAGHGQITDSHMGSRNLAMSLIIVRGVHMVLRCGFLLGLAIIGTHGLGRELNPRHARGFTDP